MNETIGQPSDGEGTATPSKEQTNPAGAPAGGGGRGGEGQGPPDGEGQPPVPSGPWGRRVAFSQTDEGLPFAYRPHGVITTRGPEALKIAKMLSPDASLDAERVGPYYRLSNINDPILLVMELRLNGIEAQLNHVFFSHDVSGNPVYGTPVYGTPVYGTPVYGTPVYGTPVYGTPVYGTPVYGTPVYGTPVYGTKADGSRHVEPTHSSAVPPPCRTKTKDLEARIGADMVVGSPKVIVLDTGLAADRFRPAILGSGITPATPKDVDHPDENDDGCLDPTAGHGTFIAGVIAQIAPGCDIDVHRVLSTFGDGDEWVICHRIHHLQVAEPHRTILSLSFGGYALDRPHLMAWTIRHIQHKGVHVVASAGNDATSRPAFPAAFAGVVAVGALSPSGPASFTNYGEWVTACAPGYDLLSTFFDIPDEDEEHDEHDDYDEHDEDEHEDDEDARDEEDEEHEEDEDCDDCDGLGDFDGWALWSGTSFAGPVVVGNLARLMMADGSSTKKAIARLIDTPTLTSLPFLGTVVDAM